MPGSSTGTRRSKRATRTAGYVFYDMTADLAFTAPVSRTLATADLDQARAFVRSALGPLEPTDDTTRRLAATVKVFLEEDSSSSRAARRLGIHENTVRYRLRQAESLLGETISARSLDLRVALEIAGAALGDPGEA